MARMDVPNDNNYTKKCVKKTVLVSSFAGQILQIRFEFIMTSIPYLPQVDIK